MLATVLQMGNWFALVKTTVFGLHMGKKTNRKNTRGTFTCDLIVNLKMETAMERKAIWERDTALESAVEGHCSAKYQTLPMGSFFEEKVPFVLISIKNEGFRFLLDDNYLK